MGILIGLVLVTDLIIFPHYLKNKITNVLSQSCPACQVHIGGVQINPFKNAASATYVSFVNDPKSPTIIKISLSKIAIVTDFRNLLEKNETKVIDLVEVQDFAITIEENYNPQEPPKSEEELKKLEASYGGKFLEGLPPIKSESIRLKNAKLDYILHKFGKEAQITVSEINTQISKFGTRKDLGPRFIVANLTGKVQKTGHLKFYLRADLFSVENEDRIDISIAHQSMADLDSFFVYEDGIEMKGEINDVHANVRINQGQLSGSLFANYHDLDLHMVPTPEAGKLKVSFENILQGLKVAKTKPDKHKPPPVAFIKYSRKPNDSIVEFILQGLKGAAFKVVSN